MNSLRNILEEDSNKHNFCLEYFTGDASEQYTTSVTNSQDKEDDVTKEEINTGLNAVENFIFPQNAALKEWSHLLGFAQNIEGTLVREFYSEMKAYNQI